MLLLPQTELLDPELNALEYMMREYKDIPLEKMRSVVGWGCSCLCWGLRCASVLNSPRACLLSSQETPASSSLWPELNSCWGLTHPIADAYFLLKGAGSS